MAFFGLTSLGVQNPFHAAQETTLSVFTLEDFEKSYDTVASEHDHLFQYTQLDRFIRVLYRCPAKTETPKITLSLVKLTFERWQDELSIPKQVFLQEMDALKEMTLKEDGAYYHTSNEFASIEAYQASLLKQQRMQKGPTEKYDTPLTTSQQLGWEKPTEITKRLPKKSCEETKYASAILQAGMID